MLKELTANKNRGITYSDLYHFIYTYLGASVVQDEKSDSDLEYELQREPIPSVNNRYEGYHSASNSNSRNTTNYNSK